MNSFELITYLPSALSCTIMQDWLRLKSVVALNSAFCCHSHRSMFLDLVQSDEYYICEQVYIKGSSKILNVLHLYGEKLRSVVVDPYSFSPAKERLIVENCHNLTHVRFRGFGICSHKLARIFSDRTVLVDLTDSYMDDVTSYILDPLYPNLTSLGLSATTRLDSHTLSQLVSSCPNIVHLDVAHNDLTDSDVLSIVTRWKYLRGLNIEGCANLTDVSLVYIYTHCAKTLHTLQMNCLIWDHESHQVLPAPLLSSAAISELLEHCTQLRTFHIGGEVVYYGDDIPWIQLPSTALCKITTLIIEDYVRVEFSATSSKSSLMLQSLMVKSCHPIHSLSDLIINSPNIREVFLNTFLTGESATKLKINALKSIKSGAEIKRMRNWEERRKHFVMNM